MVRKIADAIPVLAVAELLRWNCHIAVFFQSCSQACSWSCVFVFVVRVSRACCSCVCIRTQQYISVLICVCVDALIQAYVYVRAPSGIHQYLFALHVFACDVSVCLCVLFLGVCLWLVCCFYCLCGVRGCAAEFACVRQCMHMRLHEHLCLRAPACVSARLLTQVINISMYR